MLLKRFICFLLLNLIIAPLYAKPSSTSLPPPVVETAPVQMLSWQTETAAVGTLYAHQGITLKAETSGRVTGVYFQSGQEVTQGQALVQLNPANLKAQLAAAQAKTTLSAANYRRALILFKKHIFAQQDLDTVLSTYQADKADEASIQAQYDETLIKAPFSGKLGLRLVDLGTYINTGDSITNLQDISLLRVEFQVPETALSAVAVGQTVLIHSSAYPSQVFKGQIYALNAEIDSQTRTLGVRASLPNSDHKLLPGGFVEVTVQSGQPQELVTIPETALNFDANGIYVYQVGADHKAHKRYVILGEHRNGQVSVLKGLMPKDQIITVGSFKVIDGSPIISKSSK